MGKYEELMQGDASLCIGLVKYQLTNSITLTMKLHFRFAGDGSQRPWGVCGLRERHGSQHGSSAATNHGYT